LGEVSIRSRVRWRERCLLPAEVSGQRLARVLRDISRN